MKKSIFLFGLLLLALFASSSFEDPSPVFDVEDGSKKFDVELNKASVNTDRRVTNENNYTADDDCYVQVF